MGEPDEAYDELMRVMKRQCRERGEGAWAADRLRVAREALAVYRVAVASVRAKNSGRRLLHDLLRLDTRVALFRQYVNARRLEWSELKLRSLGRPDTTQI